MDIATPFQLLGDDYKIDEAKKRVSGSLVFQGKDTGVDIEFRSGGPAVGYQNSPAVAYQDHSVTMVFANLDEIIAGSAKAPMQAVVAPMNGDPQAVIYDPAQHKDWNSIADIGQTDTKVLYNNNSRAAFAYLVGSGILRPTQVDSSYDGSPSQFVAARGKIAVQGYATNEVGVYESIPQWRKPVGNPTRSAARTTRSPLTSSSCTCTPLWLKHCYEDVPFTRAEFIAQYSAVFPGASFAELHRVQTGMVWHAGEQHSSP
jgi:hypothetical protein